MKTEHREVLLECLRRMDELEAADPPPAWKTWLVAVYLEEAEHGPRYAAGDWFNATAPHLQMRYRRALDDLERAGLLTTWRRWERRLSNVRLTPAGLKAARQLQAEEPCPQGEGATG